MACRGVGRCGNRIGNFRLAARKQNRAQASGCVADSAAGRSGRDAAARQGDDEVRRRAQARCAAETEGRLGHRCGLQEAQGRRQRWQRSGGERQWWQSGGGERRRRRRRRGGGGERRPVAHAWRLWLGEQLGLAPRVVSSRAGDSCISSSTSSSHDYSDSTTAHGRKPPKPPSRPGAIDARVAPLTLRHAHCNLRQLAHAVARARPSGWVTGAAPGPAPGSAGASEWTPARPPTSREEVKLPQRRLAAAGHLGCGLQTRIGKCPLNPKGPQAPSPDAR